MNLFPIVEILHVDEHIFVVAKPPGLLAQPDHTGDADVLTLGKRRIEEMGQEDPFLGLVHRLDRPTSGIMVLARTPDAARILSRQFRERTAQKQYLALVEGELRGIGTWTDYIAKLGRRPTLVPPDHSEGKRAELDWQALASTGKQTLLLMQLHTGRPHQIRLQGGDRGHPVVGDTRYGAPSALGEGDIALHHAILRFEHPAHQRMNTFIAEVPSRFASCLTASMRKAIERIFDRAQIE